MGTNSGQCRTNLICNETGGGPVYVPPVVTPERVRCETTSNNKDFVERGFRVHQVRSEVINKCIYSYGTTAFECEVNIQCNDGSYAPPMMTCSTRSHRQQFVDSSRDAELTKRHVIEKCMQSRNTDFYQCRRNAQCRRQ